MAYSFGKSITIDHTKCGASNSTNFPMLFSGTYDGTGGEPDLRTAANGGDVENTDTVGGITVPADLVFTSDSGLSTLLKWEVEFYDAATGQIVAWVKIPTVDHSTSTVIYLGYGDAAVTTWQGDVNATWNSNFKAVYHVPNGTSLTANDSTASGLNGTLVNTPTASAGQIDGASHFVQASTQAIKNVSASPVSTFPVTMSCWAKMGNTSFAVNEFRALLAMCELTANPAKGFLLYCEFVSGDHRFGVYTNHGANTYTILKALTFDTNWHLYHAVYENSSTYRLHIDGVLQTGTTTFGTPGSANPTPDSVSFGGRLFNTTSVDGPWEGDLDEAHFVDIALGADWITTEYNNQSSPSTFYSIGTIDITLAPAAATLTFTGGTPTTGNFLDPVAAAMAFVGGTPVVTLVGFNLSPATATLTFTGGTPVVNYINVRPDPGTLAFRTSTPGVTLVTTAASGTVAVIAGTSYYWDDQSPATISKGLSRAWTATFEIVYSGGSKPAPGDEVALFWLSVKRFGGIVLSTAETRIKGPANYTRIQVTCTGFQSYLNRAIVAKLYTVPISGWPIMIFDIWDNHLRDFGISLVYPQGPLTGFDEHLFHYITVEEIFQRCKDENSGYDYQITDDKALIWQNQGAGGGAPFTLRDGDVNQDSVTVTRNNSKFRNKQWVLPSANLIALNTQSFVATAGQIAFPTTYNLNETPIIEVNSVQQDVTQIGIWDGSPWYYIPDGIGVFRTPGAPALGAGATVDVSYTNPFPIGFSAQDDASIAAVGLYESVYQAKNIIDGGTATAMAQALLALYGTTGNFPEYINFTYNSKSQPAWLLPGYVVDVLRTFPDATGNYVVEEVQSKLEKLKVWRHSVTLRLGKGDVSESFERDFLTAARVPIVSPPFRATFEMDMTNEGQSTGLSPNRYTVQLPPGTVQATIASWDWWFPANPPTGADYEAQILLNGSPIVTINVPDGSTTVQSGIQFSSANITVVNGDVFAIFVTQVGSSTPGRYSLGHLNMIV